MSTVSSGFRVKEGRIRLVWQVSGNADIQGDGVQTGLADREHGKAQTLAAEYTVP
jgi:hypothetical protein